MAIKKLYLHFGKKGKVNLHEGVENVILSHPKNVKAAGDSHCYFCSSLLTDTFSRSALWFYTITMQLHFHFYIYIYIALIESAVKLTFCSVLLDYWLRPFYCTVSHHYEEVPSLPDQLPGEHTGLLPHSQHMNLWITYLHSHTSLITFPW